MSQEVSCEDGGWVEGGGSVGMLREAFQDRQPVNRLLSTIFENFLITHCIPSLSVDHTIKSVRSV